jgi:TatD DNase family protein
MIDIGANLTNKRFEKDFNTVIEEAAAADVSSIIITGTDLANSKVALDLCNNHSDLFCTAGVHPHDASSYNDETHQALANLLNNKKVLAVGECGLDFNRNFSTPEQQIRAFENQLLLATACQKPVFLHEREAFKTQYPLLQKYRDSISGGVVHCFTGNKQELLKYLELDLYIGITGWICDERRGQELQALIPLIPDNRLLIETDSPYLTPRSLTGKRKKAKNVPANLGHIAEFIAKLRDQSLSDIKEMTINNTTELFKL